MEAIKILYTVEVRWFVEGPLSPRILHGFLQGEKDDPQARLDRYLLFPGCQSVGVKEREGRFEIKARWRSAEIARFAENVVGRCDGWAKWSYGRPPVTHWLDALSREPEGWIEVQKTRWLLQFSMDVGAPELVGPDAQPSEGCGIELTSIRVRESCWWSVGLEAFGTRDRLRTNLFTVAEHFLPSWELSPPLGVVNSCAYPAWLNHFASADGGYPIPHPGAADRIEDGSRSGHGSD